MPLSKGCLWASLTGKTPSSPSRQKKEKPLSHKRPGGEQTQSSWQLNLGVSKSFRIFQCINAHKLAWTFSFVLEWRKNVDSIYPWFPKIIYGLSEPPRMHCNTWHFHLHTAECFSHGTGDYSVFSKRTPLAAKLPPGTRLALLLVSCGGRKRKYFLD